MIFELSILLRALILPPAACTSSRVRGIPDVPEAIHLQRAVR
ncbi:MAG: hypothetical protein ACYDAE_15375 [Steroidobacteraceae bacterium]